MPDLKLSDQPITAAMADTDVMLSNEDQGGSVYVSKQITWASIKAELEAQS